jgi:hypothetical protein
MKLDDPDSIKRELHARIDPIIEDVARELSRRLGENALFMTPAEYAVHAKVSVKTVRKWLSKGLPANRKGRNVRVIVDEAGKWDLIDATKHSAAMNAHGAKS